MRSNKLEDLYSTENIKKPLMPNKPQAVGLGVSKSKSSGIGLRMRPELTREGRRLEALLQPQREVKFRKEIVESLYKLKN
ncbi:MAG: hypothetical protein HQK91_14385 [Nitrospirae bacterium]|nr:hypothetical protein [Nitrospirota bacterium]MBF0542626.1 hypothetical protein [Nitrospirota bacterium]